MINQSVATIELHWGVSPERLMSLRQRGFAVLGHDKEMVQVAGKTRKIKRLCKPRSGFRIARIEPNRSRRK